ncbi:hypothetical protein D9M69_397920 [compost metagenome]
MQGVLDAAVDRAIDQQTRYLAFLHMRHAGHRVMHPAVQQPALGEGHAHAAVLDEHLAASVAQLRPARLEGQLRVADLEVQADGVGGRRRVLVHRALELEVALVHPAAADRGLQPLGQRRVEGWHLARQVLLGKTRIAVAQADAQVEVILGLRVAVQAQQHVGGQLAVVALDPGIGHAQGEGLLVEAPGQPPGHLAVMPGAGELVVEVQGEVVAVQAHFAAGERAAEAAADVLGAGDLVVRRDADAVQVARHLPTLGRLGDRPVVELQVAQGAARLEPGQVVGGRRRQRRQGLHQRQQRADVEAVGAQPPRRLGAFAGLPRGEPHLAPARLAEAQGQVVEQQAQALAVALEVGVEHQVIHRHRLALGIAGVQLRHMQARHAALHAALVGLQPELAAEPQAVHAPVAGQPGRQPLGPVALRQAEVEVGAGGAPVLGIQPGAQVEGQRLAVRQEQTAIEALAQAAAQAEVEVGEGEWRGVQRLDGELAVAQRHPRDPLQLRQGPVQVERPGAARQPLQAPAAIGGLLEAEVQALHGQRGQARLALEQAGQHVGDHLHLVQAHQLLALADLHVMGVDQRRKTAPAALQAADPQRHAERRAGVAFHLRAILGDPGHQLAAEADVQRGQHQHQGEQRGPRAQQRDQPVAQALHVRSVSAVQSSTTSYCSWEYMLSTWNLMVRPMKASRSATLPDPSSSRRSTTFWLASTR